MIIVVQWNCFTPCYLQHCSQQRDVLRLAPIDECTYCDKNWLKGGRDEDDVDDDMEVKLIHPDIPTNTAELLRIPSLMSRYLDAEELGMEGNFL